MRASRWLTVVSAACLLLLAGCGAFFVRVGLNNADKIAGVVAAMLAIGALLLGFYRYFQSRLDPGGEAWRADNRRKHLARHLTVELKSLANAEHWRDSKYAELEAEIEMEGARRRRLSSRAGTGLRRMKSLSAALESSTDRLILLEGEPGAGKSMALRHVAQRMARIAEEEKGSSRAIIPLYVNLKGFRPEGHVNDSAIHKYIQKSVNTGNNSEVEDALEELFSPGIQSGSWLFLFDSFDEIPAILSSVEADAVVEKYSAALQGFMADFNNCRAVVASREFRGPRRLGWTRFRVLRLTAGLGVAVRLSPVPPRQNLITWTSATNSLSWSAPSSGWSSTPWSPLPSPPSHSGP